MSLFANFTTGKLIMIISALMFIVLLYFFIKDFYGKVVEDVKTNGIGPEPIEPVVVASLQKTHQLEEVINQKIANMKLDLMAERLRITSTAEVLKNLAVERHLPETLYQIYFETRAFPKKSLEAQQTDLEWHAQAGITDLKVDPLPLDDGTVIHFTLHNYPYTLTAINHRFARTYYVELTLRDVDDVRLFVVRVKANEATGRDILETAIIEMKSGDWIDDIASCRLLMDKRKTEVQLMAEHREVEMLKQRFVLNHSGNKLSASKTDSGRKKG
ncbi:hypothetical protein FD975_02185 [Polynucleobacter sp. AP-Jannik-300A-C4]|jgi:hypothetical protein|uniref:hypothetical protein n=1 Tax=Polynucleobacter sp. AP-Jannik-300A-C4 TaxID=2576928 RepID=UPI001BFCE598|nr:hypothetical protein [Polynucleobacter sp. AP-Jannik-300A-C4]QWE23035.1 hypothetical protein FD975_02185 [Polynucleobacter sp. AP-Jannik-300A-C4]